MGPATHGACVRWWRAQRQYARAGTPRISMLHGRRMHPQLDLRLQCASAGPSPGGALRGHLARGGHIATVQRWHSCALRHHATAAGPGKGRAKNGDDAPAGERIAPRAQPPTRAPTTIDTLRASSLGFFREHAAHDDGTERDRADSHHPVRDLGYDASRWALHRSHYRHVRHIRVLPRSVTLRRLLWPDLFVVGTTAAGLHYYNTTWATSAADVVCLPQQPFTLTAAALALLLVFRTNASYSRVADARGHWDAIVSTLRTMMRRAALSPRARGDGGAPAAATAEPRSQDVLRWSRAFVRVLTFHLLGHDERSLLVHGSAEEELKEEEVDRGLARELARILSPADVLGVMGASHRPLYVLERLERIGPSVPSSPPWTPSNSSLCFARTFQKLIYARNVNTALRAFEHVLPLAQAMIRA